MSLKNKFNMKIPNIFNKADFIVANSVDELIAEKITSATVISNNVQGTNGSGQTDSYITQSNLDGQLGTLKNQILGSTNLQTSLDTILEIDQAINNDPQFYQTITTSIGTKANQSDLTTLSTNVTNDINNLANNYYNKTTSDATYATITNLNTTNTNISNLQSKTNALSYNSSTNTTTINSKLIVSSDNSNNGNMYIGDGSGNDICYVKANLSSNGQTITPTQLGYISGLTSSAQTQINAKANSSDLTTLSNNLANNYYNSTTSDGKYATITNLATTNTNVTNLTNNLANNYYNKTSSDAKYALASDLSTTNSNVSSLSTNKLDKTASIYYNTTCLNAGTNQIYNLLQSGTGSLTSQCIKLSPSSFTENNALVFNKDSWNLEGINTSYASPMTLIICTSGTTIDSCTRFRANNIGFTGNVVINNTTGRHSFIGCTFNNNISFTGTNTNFVNFQYCTFAGQVNVNNLYGGGITFFNCDFSGATLTLSQALQQQIIINSCFNLPSFSLNALLNGFNMTVSASKVDTVSLNCSGSVSLGSNTLAISNVNNLQSSLDGKQPNLVYDSVPTASSNNMLKSGAIYTALSTKADTSYVDTNLALKANDNAVVKLSTDQTISGTKTFSGAIVLNSQDLNSRLTTDETNISNLQSKTNSISYNSGTDTLTINAKLSVAKDISNNGNMIIGDASADTLTVNATPTFIVSPIVPTPTTGDNTTKVASTAFVKTAVDSAISTLVNGAPSALNQINELANALNNDPNYASTITTALSTKVNNSGNETIAGTKTFSGAIVLNSQDLNTRLTTDETNITNLQAKTNALTYNSSTNTTTVNSKLIVSSDISDNGSLYLGDGSGNDICYVNANLSSNGQTITPTQLGYISGLTSNAQTQITARALDSAVVHNSGAEMIAGVKTFSSAPILPSNSISNTMINNSCINSGYCDATSSIQTQLNGKQATLSYDSVPTASSTNIVNSGNIYSALQSYQPTSAMSSYYTKTATDSLLSAKQNTLTFDSTPTSASTNPVTSGGIYTALSSYLTTSSASSTYLTQSSASSTYQTQSGMSSYLTTSNASTTYAGLSSNNTMSGGNIITVAECYEQVNSVSSVTNALSLNYSTCKGVNYIQTPTSNFSVAITNVPTSSTNASYTITLVIPAKYYGSSCTINGTSRTMNASGGLANISVNASATYVLQTITIAFLNSSTPVVFTNVASLF